MSEYIESGELINLNFAAMAAGIEHAIFYEAYPKDFFMMPYAKISKRTYWNPYCDDGDALRLAVKLGLIFPHMHDRFERFQRLYLLELDKNNEPSVATRNAIVLAASEIGRGII